MSPSHIPHSPDVALDVPLFPGLKLPAKRLGNCDGKQLVRTGHGAANEGVKEESELTETERESGKGGNHGKNVTSRCKGTTGGKEVMVSALAIHSDAQADQVAVEVYQSSGS